MNKISVVIRILTAFLVCSALAFGCSSEKEKKAFNVSAPAKLPKIESSLSIVVDDFFRDNDSSYVLCFWLDTKSLRGIGRGRNVVAIKYEQDNPTRSGFAFAFNRTNSAIFPEVYWGDVKGHHGWFTFEEYAPTGDWALFSVVYNRGKLELWLKEKDDFVNLGGFALDSWDMPLSDAPFMLGKEMVAKLKGRVGAISLLKFSGEVEIQQMQGELTMRFLQDVIDDRKLNGLEVFSMR